MATLQAEEDWDDSSVEEVRDLRQFILEVPLFQGMLQAEEAADDDSEMGFIEGT
eukprot:COSAG02_NODE_5272_length_4480_cov_2.100205_6_plen_54_part_00